MVDPVVTIVIAACVAISLVLLLVITIALYCLVFKGRKSEVHVATDEEKKKEAAKKQWDSWVEEGEHVRLKGMKRHSDDSASPEPIAKKVHPHPTKKKRDRKDSTERKKLTPKEKERERWSRRKDPSGAVSKPGPGRFPTLERPNSLSPPISHSEGGPRFTASSKNSKMRAGDSFYVKEIPDDDDKEDEDDDEPIDPEEED